MPYPPDMDDTDPVEDAEPEAADDAGTDVSEAIQDAIAGAGPEADPVADDEDAEIETDAPVPPGLQDDDESSPEDADGDA